jgi:hypothetical protein
MRFGAYVKRFGAELLTPPEQINSRFSSLLPTGLHPWGEGGLKGRMRGSRLL